MRVNSLMASPSKSQSSSSTTTTSSVEDENGLRRGPWTVDEDALLVHSISVHGEGRWNLLATRSGLRRTGKSCRLRWLNYLKPEVKRGNLSPQEQLLILDLHSRWGNRWSKIAQQLPGRTDNEIKNYWRTRVQKQAKLLNIDTNSPEFKDIINRFWIPRLVHQINESSSTSSSSSSQPNMADDTRSIPRPSDYSDSPPTADGKHRHYFTSEKHELNFDPDQNSTSSESMDISRVSDPFSDVPSWHHDDGNDMRSHLNLGLTSGDFDYPIPNSGPHFPGWMDYDSDAGCFWNFDELWQF